MADINLDNYIPVNERIQKFYEAHPDGRLAREKDWEIQDVGGQTFLVYHALAFRSPDDPKPGQGVAWEPIPGPTSFTRDSELMNAETAAIGRAIAMVGIAVQRGIATQEDVKARQGQSNGAKAKPSKGDSVSEGQAKFAHVLKKKAGLDDDSFSVLLKTRFEVESGRVEDLPWKRFDQLKTFLENPEAKLPVKTGETDVPADTDGMGAKAKQDEEIPF